VIVYDSVSAGVCGVALWLLLSRWFVVPGVGVFVLLGVCMVAASYVCSRVSESE